MVHPNHGALGHAQPNVVIMRNGQPNAMAAPSYGVPMSCVCTPNTTAGLGVYGSGLSTIPMAGQSTGQSMVYNVPGKRNEAVSTVNSSRCDSLVHIPDNVPIDGILRQLGIDPSTLQRSNGFPTAGTF